VPDRVSDRVGQGVARGGAGGPDQAGETRWPARGMVAGRPARPVGWCA